MEKYNRYPLLVPALVVSLLFIPWLGEMLFYSKGESREAIVAVSILDSGNWILPLSYGNDIPYKPPLLAWLIAVFSLVFNGGTVNEFTSRLPSALSGIFLLVFTWRTIRRYADRDKAWVTLLVLATCFEYFRATVACRVDMLLTACMIGGLYCMYSMRKGIKPMIAAILLLSGATLTKGPVGTLLPCLAMGIYFILIKTDFRRNILKTILICLASFILPAVWYWLAYRQGGNGFAALAWEENIGRLTGNMGYESHVNPWYYNIVSLIAGMLPWTVPVAIAFCFRKTRAAVADTMRKFRWREESFMLFALVVFFTVFLFYCIPSSKRSVYLLPCYPFMAYGAAYVLMQQGAKALMNVWSKFLSVIAIIAVALIITLSFVLLEKLPCESLKWEQYIVLAVLLLVALRWLVSRGKKADGIFGSLLLTYLIMVTYSAVFAPALMNPRSDKIVAEKIREMVPADAPIVSHIEGDSLMRYYTTNFYLDDRIRLYNDTVSPDAWIITDAPNMGANSEPLLLTERSCDNRKPVYLIHPACQNRPNR